MYKAGFLTTLIGGTLLVLSASSWFNAWVGLELNMLSFVPLVVGERDVMGAEAGIKYFLVQAVASIMVLFVVVFMEVEWRRLGGSLVDSNLIRWGVGFALAMKLGMAPLHF